jgi:hypothetical protein
LNERISESAAAAAVDVAIPAGTAIYIVAMSEDIIPLNYRSWVRCGCRDFCSCQYYACKCQEAACVVTETEIVIVLYSVPNKPGTISPSSSSRYILILFSNVRSGVPNGRYQANF